MQRICVIGGTGFLGTNLIQNLSHGNDKYKVFCGDLISNDSSNFLHVDVTKPESFSCLSNKNIDVIINLAAVHRDDVKPISKYDEVNIQGAVNVCDLARKNNIQKIIFTSSVAIYGFAPPDTDEAGEPLYFNDYGRTKFYAEQVYKEWQLEDEKNRTLVIVRPTVIFGEGNRGNVFNLLKQIASGKFVMFGNGKNQKSMAYVKNVAAFIKFTLSFNKGLHIYNYIDKPDFDMNTLVAFVRDKIFKKNNVGLRLPSVIGILIGYLADAVSMIIGKSLPVSYIRVKKFMSTTKFSSSINKTGFIAPYDLRDGLSNTIYYDFIEDNSDKKVFETE